MFPFAQPQASIQTSAAGARTGVGPLLKAGEGGRYSSLVSRGVVGDELVPHHMPQAALRFTTRLKGGALVVPDALHVRTRTFGYKGVIRARMEKDLPFRHVLARDIRDIRNLSGRMYNQGLRDVINYYRCSYPELFTKP